MNIIEKLKDVSYELKEVSELLHGDFYVEDNQHGNTVQFYNTKEPVSFKEYLEQLEGIIYDVIELVDQIIEQKESCILNLDIYHVFDKILELIAEDSKIYKIANFDYQNTMESYMEDHLYETTDGGVDNCAQCASEEAADIFESICLDAENDVTELENELYKFSNIIHVLILSI